MQCDVASIAKNAERADAKWPIADVRGPVLVVGDLHGDLDAARRVAELARQLRPETVVFLGDYVDRGDKGCEVLAMAVEMWAEGLAIALRGNHESLAMNEAYGFARELAMKIGRPWEALRMLSKRVYARMPLAALCCGALLVHGGLARKDGDVATLSDMASITPSDAEAIDEAAATNVAVQLLWNDPWSGEDWAPSPRGPGIWLYGRRPTQRFLETSGLSLIVRGHEYVEEGYKVDHGSVITVFTSAAGPYRGTRRVVALLGEDGVEVIELDTGRAVARLPPRPKH